MKGRPNKPRHLHLVDGTLRKDRDNAKAPDPKPGIPRVPVWLDEVSKRHWKRLAPQLHKLGVLTVADGDMLALLCSAAAEIERYSAILAEQGESQVAQIMNKQGDVVGTRIFAHPLLTARADAWRRMMAGLQQFGITPATRSKVSRTDGGKKGPVNALEALLAEGQS